MFCLELKAEIIANKSLEFNQSKMTFIEKIQTKDGYLGFYEKQGAHFHIKILWESRKLLNQFIQSDVYSVFRGAIIILCTSNTISINKEENKLSFIK